MVRSWARKDLSRHKIYTRNQINLQKFQAMKKFLGLFMIVLLFAACSTDRTTEQPTDKWNGYFDYLKAGETYHTLWAGQHIDVGEVIYGINENAEFYVTYNCTGDWQLVETHLFAGELIDMPKTVKRGGDIHPKVGRFDQATPVTTATDHNPWVSTFTYTIPLDLLPPCSVGFTVAAHAVVENTATNQNETAWADGANAFTDKDWGWYDDYTYDCESPDDFTIIYGIEYDSDSLMVWMIDVTNGGSESELILTEYVGSTGSSYDGSAFDEESGNFFFVNESNELWVNNLQSSDESYYSGTLDGPAQSADFYEGNYYYVDPTDNTIHQVAFDSDFLITSDIIISTIPSTVEVTDVAMSPEGDYMYLVGNVGDGTTEMITWDIANDSYATVDMALEEDTQIAYGSDGLLYAIQPTGMGYSETDVIDTSNWTYVEINDDDVIIVDPFADISSGPIL
jgi:hypothetical protein